MKILGKKGSFQLIKIRHLRIVEAALLLPLAFFAVRLVRLERWRGTLRAPDNSSQPSSADFRTVKELGQAVERAAQLVPGEYVCLPKAMVCHWMAKRRRISTGVVFGIAAPPSDGSARALHAWIEHNGTPVLDAAGNNGYPIQLRSFSN